MNTATKMLLLLNSQPTLIETDVECEECHKHGKHKHPKGKRSQYHCEHCGHIQEVAVS